MPDPTSQPSTDRTPTSAPVWLAYATLVAIGCNLRSPLTAVPPVLEEIRVEMGLGAPAAGVLTSIPVLCFGLLPPLLSPFIKHLGIDRAVYVALIGSGLGMLIRPCSGMLALLAGTLLIGVSLALGNIAALLVIARDFARQGHAATGVYTASMNVGAMLTIAMTVPLAHALGWRLALACWSVLPIAALALWRIRENFAPPATQAASHKPPHAPVTPVLSGRPIIWVITAAFTIHIFCYYALAAWLPVYLLDSGTMTARAAGFVASSFQILSLSGALGVPLLARRFSLPFLLIVMGAAWTLTPCWLLLAPAQWYIWSPIGSFAHGGTFVLIFMMIMQHARDLDDNRRVSTLVQSTGYCLASAGPIMMGWLHARDGDWTRGMGLLIALTFTLLLLGLLMHHMTRQKL